MNKQTEDIKLIRRALKGDQRSFQALYQKYRQSLFMVCLRYAKDKSTAQDYLQEAFINIFKNLHRFDESKGIFEPWAKRIAINVCLMHLRKQTLYSVGITEAEGQKTNMADALSELALQEMLDMIQQLPQGYRTIFNLYVIDGYSHKEIAEKLNITEGTSKSQLSKARNLLQKKILINQQLYRQIHG